MSSTSALVFWSFDYILPRKLGFNNLNSKKKGYLPILGHKGVMLLAYLEVIFLK
jgi:hypothetical protein